MSTPGDRLREERDRLGLTQPEFAHACGIEKGTQIAYEKGRRQPDLAYLVRAVQLGVDVLYVVAGSRNAAEVVHMVRERLPCDAPGNALVLTAREHVLIDNYRAADDSGRRAVEAAAAALTRWHQEARERERADTEGKPGQGPGVHGGDRPGGGGVAAAQAKGR